MTTADPGRRRLLVAGGAVLVALVATAVVVAALAWLQIRPVRDELTRARQTLEQAIADPSAVRGPQRWSATAARIDDALGAIDRAHQRVTRSTAVDLTRFVPVVATQRTGLLTLLEDAKVAAATARDLLGQVEALQVDAHVRNGTVPLSSLRTLAEHSRAAGRRLETLSRPDSGLWASLGDARRQLNQLVRTNATRLLNGADALEVTRSFLGADRDRRHFVAIQNNAEMRDQGMVLSYAIVHFSGGRATFEHAGTVAELTLDQPVATPVPDGTTRMFGSLRPTQVWQSVNATADFPWTARTMVDMYRQRTGEPLDGVIAVDVPALAALLTVVGPIQVPGVGEPISADNVSRVLLHDLYQGEPPLRDLFYGQARAEERGVRRERLGDVTRAVFDRLMAGDHDAVALGRDLGQAAAGGHLRLWSPEETEERVFERTGLGGAPGTVRPERTFHLAVENRTATKLDYYVTVTARQDVTLTEEDSAHVRTTVVVENAAPPDAPPSYQLGPDMFMPEPGEYTAWVLLWGPAGAIQPASTPESGLRVTQSILPVPAGERREVVFDTVVPKAVENGRLLLRFVPQPRLTPIDLSVNVRPNGLRVSGDTSWQGPLDRVRTLSWRVSG